MKSHQICSMCNGTGKIGWIAPHDYIAYAIEYFHFHVILGPLDMETCPTCLGEGVVIISPSDQKWAGGGLEWLKEHDEELFGDQGEG